MLFLPVQRRDPLHLPLCQRKVKKGEILRKVPEAEILDALMEEIEKL